MWFVVCSVLFARNIGHWSSDETWQIFFPEGEDVEVCLCVCVCMYAVCACVSVCLCVSVVRDSASHTRIACSRTAPCFLVPPPLCFVVPASVPAMRVCAASPPPFFYPFKNHTQHNSVWQQAAAMGPLLRSPRPASLCASSPITALRWTFSPSTAQSSPWLHTRTFS